jgi:dTDP-4-dehydrorhamnose 3,5-epimerase
VGVELSAENKKQLWIPEGFAHGFLVLSDEAEFLYKTTDYWHAASEQCILWSDSFLKINWPVLASSALLNKKDISGLTWSTAPKFS